MEFAKNKPNKFYNPKMYKTTTFSPKFMLWRRKQKQESVGVIGMIDTLITEFDMEMTWRWLRVRD